MTLLEKILPSTKLTKLFNLKAANFKQDPNINLQNSIFQRIFNSASPVFVIKDPQSLSTLKNSIHEHFDSCNIIEISFKDGIDTASQTASLLSLGEKLKQLVEETEKCIKHNYRFSFLLKRLSKRHKYYRDNIEQIKNLNLETFSIDCYKVIVQHAIIRITMLLHYYTEKDVVIIIEDYDQVFKDPNLGQEIKDLFYGMILSGIFTNNYLTKVVLSSSDSFEDERIFDSVVQL